MRFRYEHDAKQRARHLAREHRALYSVIENKALGKFYVRTGDALAKNPRGLGGVVCVMHPDGGTIFPNEDAFRDDVRRHRRQGLAALKNARAMSDDAYWLARSRFMDQARFHYTQAARELLIAIPARVGAAR